MKTSTRTQTLDSATRQARPAEEPAPARTPTTERPRVVMDFNPLMARAMLAQKMADRHMYVPAYDDRDRERGF